MQPLHNMESSPASLQAAPAQAVARWVRPSWYCMRHMQGIDHPQRLEGSNNSRFECLVPGQQGPDPLHSPVSIEERQHMPPLLPGILQVQPM